MTTMADFRSIFEYNWRVLRDYGEALAKLPRDEVVKNREATHGSMKNIFHHILSVHDGWMSEKKVAEGAPKKNPPGKKKKKKHRKRPFFWGVVKRKGSRSTSEAGM